MRCGVFSTDFVRRFRDYDTTPSFMNSIIDFHLSRAQEIDTPTQLFDNMGKRGKADLYSHRFGDNITEKT